MQLAGREHRALGPRSPIRYERFMRTFPLLKAVHPVHTANLMKSTNAANPWNYVHPAGLRTWIPASLAHGLGHVLRDVDQRLLLADRGEPVPQFKGVVEPVQRKAILGIVGQGAVASQ